MMPEGRILEIQRLSTEDGPGIRTTVFLKGCPLRCAWCHNPESISFQPQIQWLSVRCIGCENCVRACPDHCLSRTDAGIVIHRACCTSCGKCVEACPSGAMEMLGTDMQWDKLLAELHKDRAYYEKSGGGVTLSGGEPGFQPEFVEALLTALKKEGISTALDTCGLYSPETLYRLLPYADLLLYDVKLFDPAAHKEYTGVSNELILENLRRIGDYIGSGQKLRLWIRTPLIPGATDSDENLTAIGRFLVETLGEKIERWELCAFNNLCRDKYGRLGINWKYASMPLLTAADLARCEQAARSAGLPPERIHATGVTRSGEKAENPMPAENKNE
jgi:pyruvate formate lyase activating enzyme